jgi:hypothetical protein
VCSRLRCAALHWVCRHHWAFARRALGRRTRSGRGIGARPEALLCADAVQQHRRALPCELRCFSRRIGGRRASTFSTTTWRSRGTHARTHIPPIHRPIDPLRNGLGLLCDRQESRYSLSAH